MLDTIILGDARDMSRIPSNSVHLIVTSPPYNVGMEYEQDTTFDEWVNMLNDVIKECERVLISGGRIAINIANTGRKPYLHLNGLVSKWLQDNNFLLRGEIIWDKGASGNSTAWGSWLSASNPVLRDRHEYILVASKDTYARVKGINTITKQDFTDGTTSIWQVQPERASRIGHPAPFPIEIPRRLIEMYSFKGDNILDPFMGSGTTALAAKICERHYIGYELNKDYLLLAQNRLNMLL